MTISQDGSRTEFLSYNPAEAQDYLETMYGVPVGLRLGGFPYRLRHVRQSAESLHLDTIHHAASVEVDTGEVPELVPVIQGFTGKRTDMDRDLTIGPGGLIIAGVPGRGARSWNENFGYTVASVPLSALAAAAVNRPDDELPPLEFSSVLPAWPAAGRRWASAVQYAFTELRDHPEAAGRPLAGEALMRLLAVALLDTFPSNWAELPPESSDRSDATPPVLARAMSFIESSAGLPVTVADVARAARVSVRSVELAFRRYEDTTPWAYLRGIRLEHARADLAAASPGDGTTVAGVAARWGWATPERFSSAYRARFSELPSQTLRKG